MINILDLNFNKMQFIKKVIEQNDPRFIRKLGILESLADEELLNNNLTTTTATLISIDKTMNIDLTLLKKALFEWINTHQLLQATTYRLLDKKTQKSSINMPKYFVRIEKNIEDYNNFEFLENTANSLNWSSLTETELKTPLDFINGPLWRMKVLRMNQTSEFALIFTISNSISDGRNSFSLMAQFLSILEKVMSPEKNLTKEDRQEIPLMDSSDSIVEKLQMEGKLKINSMNLIDSYHLWDKVVNRVTTKSGYKMNGVYGRIEHFILEKMKLDKLIQKMKTNTSGAKLTSLLTVIICIALKRTCLNNGVNDIPLEDFVIAMPVCLRGKLNIDNLNMGSHIGMCESLVRFSSRKGKVQKDAKMCFIKKLVLFIFRSLYYQALFLILSVLCFSIRRVSKLEVKLIEKTRKVSEGYKFLEVDLEDDREDFWALVEENSKNLHKKIENNCELGIPKREIQLLDIFLRNNFNFSSFNLVNFCVNNLGKMKSSTYLSDESRIRIVEYYMCQPCMETRFSPPLHFGITTVNGNLCCAISFSEKIYTKEFIKDLKLLILKLIQDIIE